MKVIGRNDIHCEINGDIKQYSPNSGTCYDVGSLTYKSKNTGPSSEGNDYFFVIGEKTQQNITYAI